MASRISVEDKKRIVELYAQTKNYSAVARETGFSAATVKRYVVEAENTKESKFEQYDGPIPVGYSEILFPSAENIGFLTEQEKEDLKEFIDYLRGK